MKTPLLIILLFIISLTSNYSQITVNQADLPQPGDTFVFDVDLNPIINIGTASASNQIWDFSNLAQDSIQYASYGITSNLAFSGNFPSSNLYTYGPAFLYGGLSGGVPTGSGMGYMMFSSDASGFKTIGFRNDYDGTGMKNTYVTPNELLMGIPCTYNSVFNNTSGWEISYALVPTDVDTFYRSHIVKTITCDAWGQLTSPYGSFSDVLRVHEYAVVRDSLFAVFNSVVYWSIEVKNDTINNYHYWTVLERNPLVTVYCDVNDNVEKAQYLSYSILSLNEDKYNNTIKAYPNPSSGVFNINTDELVEIKIFNQLGEVAHVEKNIKKVLDISFLNNGIYFIEITGKNIYYKDKIIIYK